MDSPPAERRLRDFDLDDEAYDEEAERSPIGIAFLLGVVVGATASTLFRTMEREEEEPPLRTRRFFKRQVARQEPRPISEVVRSEAAHVAETVIRDLGKAATRWILDLTAPPPAPPDPAEDGEDGPSGDPLERGQDGG